ncbi:MAG: cardiolipin synthase [Prevotella sp.]|nr:cardiolipin synthase [Prevotella sp.]
MEGLYIIGVVLSWIIIALTVVHVVMDNRQPARTMAWVLVIFFVPLVGIVFYLFFGINHRKQRLISQRSLDQLTKRSMLSFVGQHDIQIPEKHKQLVDLFVNQNLSLPFKDNQVDIMTDGYAFIPKLLQDIANAHDHIHIDMYIIEDDPLGRLVTDALGHKAKEGVEVRIVYDDVGCWKVKHRFIERLRKSGIEIVPFLPVRFPSFTSKANYRNHRKLIVIDGRIGYIGGMNIALRYVKGTGQQPWRDTMLRLTGGVVYALQRTFLTDWYFVDRTLITDRRYYPALTTEQPNNCLAQVVTSGSTAYPEIMQGYVRTILAARRYLYIETPYFLPNDPVLFALKTAAVGGVDVRIICPLHSDARFTDWASRSYLRELHEAGAHIYLYHAGFLHSKLLVCDDSLSTCGSTNVDFRSFENNFEANVFIYDEDTALRLKKVFLDDQAQSVPLSEVPSRLEPKFLQGLWESFTRLFSPLL